MIQEKMNLLEDKTSFLPLYLESQIPVSELPMPCFPSCYYFEVHLWKRYDVLVLYKSSMYLGPSPGCLVLISWPKVTQWHSLRFLPWEMSTSSLYYQFCILGPTLLLILFFSFLDLRTLSWYKATKVYLFMLSQDLLSSPSMLGQNIYDFYSSSSLCLEYNFPGTAFSSEMKRLSKAVQQPLPPVPSPHFPCSLLTLSSLATLSVSLWEWMLPHSKSSMCSKRRESLRVWVNFIPGTEPFLFSC